MAETAIVRIASIAAGGAGVGRLDGLAVFVPRTAPGDEVRVSLRRRARHAEGRVLGLLVPGPSRVSPTCRHYERDACGGCQLQHLDYSAQLEAKRDVVVQAFRRIARREVGVPDVVPSPARWQYRNKLTLTLRRASHGWVGGLRRYDDPDAIFALEECPITADGVLAAWRELMAAAAWLPEAGELRGMIRHTASGAVLHLTGGVSWPGASEFVASCPSLEGITWADDRGAAHVVRAGGTIGADSFAQVNMSLAGALHDHAASLALARGPERLIDAYGGSGAIARRLQGPDRTLVLIELDAAATRVARATLGPASRVVTARVESVLADELPADAVVLNPPRAGVDVRVCHVLEQAAARPATLVYVSCDPATLARDVARLPSYRVASLTLFDMFPQTAHVEVVCELVPEAA
ncbi:MAG: class I SAM-dependent RNA methyltransferase [Gemmatimonadaceae bacterium]|nr:class I SAM-dependent RNA methyltransferase [Gemmatimonadaceae bacterium]